jgi:hypothetical protein
MWHKIKKRVEYSGKCMDDVIKELQDGLKEYWKSRRSMKKRKKHDLYELESMET